MKLKTITENFWGHAALDVAGLVPGVGEAADLTNAVWYAQEGDYFGAAMSVLSVVPVVGDAIGKSAKYLGKSSIATARFIEKYGDLIAKHWDEAMGLIEKTEKLRPYAHHINAAVQEALDRRRTHLTN